MPQPSERRTPENSSQASSYEDITYSMQSMERPDLAIRAITPTTIQFGLPDTDWYCPLALFASPIPLRLTGRTSIRGMISRPPIMAKTQLCLAIGAALTCVCLLELRFPTLLTSCSLPLTRISIPFRDTSSIRSVHFIGPVVKASVDLQMAMLLRCDRYSEHFLDGYRRA